MKKVSKLRHKVYKDITQQNVHVYVGINVSKLAVRETRESEAIAA